MSKHESIDILPNFPTRSLDKLGIFLLTVSRNLKSEDTEEVGLDQKGGLKDTKDFIDVRLGLEIWRCHM